MKSRFFCLGIGLVLLVAGIAIWQFRSPALLNKEASSLEIARGATHGQTDKEGHEEENSILLTSEQITELGIQTKVANPGELAVTIATRGKLILHPDKLAHVLPKISGVAKEVKKNIGDHVKEGELLAVLESREMADIKANYLAAKEKAGLVLSLYEREKRLFEKKVSPEQDFLHAKSAYEEAKITIQLAKQKLHALGISDEEITGLFNEHDPNLRYYDIRSPIEGIVIARHITRGEFVENTTTIYEIADLSTIWIEIGIYPKDLVRVKEGQMVDISMPVDKAHLQAKIIYLSPIIQDETITAKAVAELQNPGKNWRPGSFVKVNIATENVAAPIAISKEAIQELDGKEFIFVRIPEGFEKRQVQLGISDTNNVEVIAGLQAGEEYASSKTFLLKADFSKKEAEHEH